MSTKELPLVVAATSPMLYENINPNCPSLVTLNLPGDMWTKILSYCGIKTAVQLWLTGNRSLRNVLGSGGGIREYKQTAVFPNFFVPNFPSNFLSQLSGLRILRMAIEDDVMPRFSRHLNLENTKLLPRRLIELELGFFDNLTDECVEFLPTSLVTLLLPMNTTLTSEGIKKIPMGITDLNIESNRYLDMDTVEHFSRSSLTKLVIHSKPRNYGLPAEDILQHMILNLSGALRPCSIRHLSFEGKYVVLKDFSLLLEKTLLKSIKLPQMRLFSFNLVLEHTSTSLIDLDLSNVLHCPATIFENLPKVCKHLKVGWDRLSPPDWPVSAFANLPYTLKTLWMMPNVADVVDNTIWMTPLPPNLDLGLFGVLPRDLKKLAVWALQKDGGRLLDLPPSLEELDIQIGTGKQLEVANLPKTLKKIISRPSNGILTSAAELPAFDFEELNLIAHNNAGPSSGLSCVNLVRMNPNQTSFPVKIAKICPKLKVCSLYFTNRHNVTLSSLCILPNRLTSLTLDGRYPVTDEDIESLPDFLIHLVLKSPATELTDNALGKLPYYLETFHVTRCSKIKNPDRSMMPIGLRSLQLFMNRLNVSNLPSMLSTLILEDDYISDACFKFFPPTIVHLVLRSTLRITGACFKYLNIHLAHLEIPYIDFKDSDVIHLPPNLHTLIADQGPFDLTNDSAIDFPRMLKTLEIPGTWYTNVAIKNLPRSLSHLALTHVSLLTPECLTDLPARLATIRLSGYGKSTMLSVEDVRRARPNIRAQWG